MQRHASRLWHTCVLQFTAAHHATGPSLALQWRAALHAELRCVAVHTDALASLHGTVQHSLSHPDEWAERATQLVPPLPATPLEPIAQDSAGPLVDRPPHTSKTQAASSTEISAEDEAAASTKAKQPSFADIALDVQLAEEYKHQLQGSPHNIKRAKRKLQKRLRKERFNITRHSSEEFAERMQAGAQALLEQASAQGTVQGHPVFRFPHLPIFPGEEWLLRNPRAAEAGAQCCCSLLHVDGRIERLPFLL